MREQRAFEIVIVDDRHLASLVARVGRRSGRSSSWCRRRDRWSDPFRHPQQSLVVAREQEFELLRLLGLAKVTVNAS